jgi:hypothetical protein
MTGPIPVQMHLAILEIEAWFLEETTHFLRIDPLLTPAAIAAAGFDLGGTPGASRPHPAETLDNIYKIAKKRYRKRARHIKRTLAALSHDEMYVTVRGVAPSFDEFLTSIEASLF